jgi:hypothetical protein
VASDIGEHPLRYFCLRLERLEAVIQNDHV